MVSGILAVLGGLGVFLFGMRVMSNGLQKLAGNRLRAILFNMTRNRFAGVFSGFMITCAAQSSSATTVLVVSFANAGLLTLVQALGLVMGANIGTTLTAWLVSLLGFKIKITAFALPIIGLAFPLSLMNSARARNYSETFVGFGILFLGLKFLKDAVPDLRETPEVLEFVQGLTGFGFGSVVLFVIIGTVLTFVVQSSSAATTITLAMVVKGWIGFDLAAAMVLGENIGTTITAQLAALGANRSAKRVAHFHTLFNIVGVLWVLPLMAPILWGIEHLIPGDPLTSPVVATTRVAAFHTLFNVTNTLALSGFVNYLARVVMWIVPKGAGEAEGSRLKFLQSGLLGTPELDSIEARRALQEMQGICCDMFGHLSEVIGNPKKKLGNVVDEIKREEQRTDEMEEEIINFCTLLARSGTSERIGRDVATYLEMANDIERIGDHCMNLVLLAERRWEKGYTFSEGTQAELSEMMESITGMLAAAHAVLEPGSTVSHGEAKLLENKVNKLRDDSRKKHSKRMQAGTIDVREGLIFLDMMTNMEKIGDYCWNVVSAADTLG